MKDAKRWVTWKWATRNGKRTKIPFNANSGAAASSTNPDTWGSYEDAITALRAGTGYDGLGFVLGGGFVGLDIDHCTNDEGMFQSEVVSLVESLGSYTEVSPSGDGLHVIFKGGDWKHGSGRKGSYELYASDRYFTVTGDCLMFPNSLSPVNNALEDLFKSKIRPEQQKPEPVPQQPALPAQTRSDSVQGWGNSRSDADILESMRMHSPEYWDLYMRGTASSAAVMASGAPDHSACDLKLASMLVIYCKGDEARAESLFRGSALMRPKWDEKHFSTGETYGQRTMSEAAKAYDPDRQRACEPQRARVTREVKTHYPKLPMTLTSVGAFYDVDWKELCREYLKYTGIRTGFEIFDKRFGDLMPGLYVVGGDTGAGKTTLTLQTAVSVARSGNPVIYFAMEQTRHELFSKMVTCEAFLNTPENANFAILKDINSGMVRRGILNAYTEQAIHEIAVDSAISENLMICECDFSQTTVESISQTVDEYVTATGKRPLVVVDYLQLLRTSENVASDKGEIDTCIAKLKTLKNRHNLVMFVLSSFNRASNVSGTAKNTSFSGSGGIEYTADVTIVLTRHANKKNGEGLQLEETPSMRWIWLNVLKNRYGQADMHMLYRFYCAHDCFVEDDYRAREQEQSPAFSV